MGDGLLLVVLAGCAMGAGAFLVTHALVPAPVRLDDALASLDGGRRAPGRDRIEVSETAEGLPERFGLWWYRHARLPLSAGTARQLALRGRSVGDFFVEKMAWAFVGFFAPIVFAVVATVMGSSVGFIPVAVAATGAVAGYFVPDLLVRRSAVTIRQGAAEALFLLFDLVVLERLANRSVTQALHSAASVSDTPVFVRIRTALDRARLEQVPPWHELSRLSRDLEVPELADIADVLRLDEHGASLAGPLRARLRELRDAALAQSTRDAQVQTERMTIWMTFPVLIFGVALLVPPVLMLVGG